MQTWTAINHLNQPIAFQDRNVDDVKDGYVKFDPRKHKYMTVMRSRTDIAVQVTSWCSLINSNVGVTGFSWNSMVIGFILVPLSHTHTHIQTEVKLQCY
jgi:hypothetical protein